MIPEFRHAVAEAIKAEIAAKTESVMSGKLDDRKARDLICEVRAFNRAIEIVSEEFRKLT